MPPSEMTGTSVSRSASATLATAEICGTPTPATMRVVQIEPGPMPTLTASAPASTSARAASTVAILPAMTWQSSQLALMRSTVSITPLEWPCAVSTTTTSTPASRSAATRSIVSGVVPTAAPTRRRPPLVLAGAREFRGLLEVLDRDHADELVPPLTTSSFLDAVLVQQREHLVLGRILAHRDQPFLAGHDRARPVRRSGPRSAGRGG